MRTATIVEAFLLLAIAGLAYVVWKQQEELTLLGGQIGRLDAGVHHVAPPVPVASDDGAGTPTATGEAAT